MSVVLLDQDSVVDYLISKEVISASDSAQVEVLTGGVSNAVSYTHLTLPTICSV